MLIAVIGRDIFYNTLLFVKSAVCLSLLLDDHDDGSGREIEAMVCICLVDGCVFCYAPSSWWYGPPIPYNCHGSFFGLMWWLPLCRWSAINSYFPPCLLVYTTKSSQSIFLTFIRPVSHKNHFILFLCLKDSSFLCDLWIGTNEKSEHFRNWELCEEFQR